jgi:hypothetical protein
MREGFPLGPKEMSASSNGGVRKSAPQLSSTSTVEVCLYGKKTMSLFQNQSADPAMRMTRTAQIRFRMLRSCRPETDSGGIPSFTTRRVIRKSADLHDL